LGIRAFVGLAALCCADAFVEANRAQAAELKVLSAFGMQPVMEALGPSFEHSTGHQLKVTLATLGQAMSRIEKGESFDVVTLPKSGIDDLVKNGQVAAGSVRIIARSGMGMVVRKGAAKPDISSSAAFRRALLDAGSMTYSNPEHGGPGGAHVAKVLERLGIAVESKPKTVFLPKAGAVATLVANGNAELAIGQIQELVAVPGVELVGPLPSDLQLSFVFSGAVMTKAKESAAGESFLDFLRAPAAIDAIKAKGLEPATP
jgi:molybdate transport system substrate-binding protein